jgi:hypothetical protein
VQYEEQMKKENVGKEGKYNKTLAFGSHEQKTVNVCSLKVISQLHKEGFRKA